jgi:hypothetical protein
MAVRLSALCAGCFLPPRWFQILISVRGWVDPRAIVWLEGLGKLKNPPRRDSNPHILACSTVPQPTTLPRAPTQNINGSEFCIYVYLNISHVRTETKCLVLLSLISLFEKIKVGLCDHHALCIFLPINFWMPEPIFNKLGMCIMARESSQMRTS